MAEARAAVASETSPDPVPAAAFRRLEAADGVSLHVAEAGPEEGPLVFLLHGFPEFWLEWRACIGPLAEAGFRVIAPDQRGYGLSDKPRGVAAYDLDLLAADILALADRLGRHRFSIVGHDWGAVAGWWIATIAPERVERFCAICAPHPAVWVDAMRRDPEQRRMSRYVRLFAIPWLPEWVIRAYRCRGFLTAMKPRRWRPPASDDLLRLYHEAWARPGALTGMINWYRALLARRMPPPSHFRITPPTLIIWGDADLYVGPALADASAALCEQAHVMHLDGVSHWAPHTRPDLVLPAVRDFLTGRDQAVGAVRRPRSP